jgi:hypothetical protein
MTIETVDTTTPTEAPPRDWLKLFQKARLFGATLDPGRRERLRRVRNRANAASLRSETSAQLEEYFGRQVDDPGSLVRRANDLDDGRHTRGMIVAALLDRAGGLEAQEEAIAAGFAVTWPGNPMLAAAEWEAKEVVYRRIAAGGGHLPAPAESRDQQRVEELKQARDAWCRQQAASLLGRALAGDVQAVFNLRGRAWTEEQARDLGGLLPSLVAYLVELEDFPDD